VAEAPHAAREFIVKKIFKRLAKELRTRGPAGFLRFLALRLVQWRGDHLYEIDLRRIANGAPTASESIVVVDRHTFGSAATRVVEETVLTEANLEYRDELRADCQLFAITTPTGEVTTYGFVLFNSFYKQILGEDSATPMIGNCYTYPQYRGRGSYPRMIRAACESLAAQGFQRAIITCAPDNAASIRGIEKAGFRRVKTLHSLVLATRWIAWTKVAPAK
jgi:RimJ/RimL family protein N-acetyltransferase